jgi:hypothetical protein
MGMSGQLHTPATLHPEKEPLVPFALGGWVGHRAGPDAVVRSKIPSPYRDSNLPIIQPVAQHYTTELSQVIVIMIMIVFQNWQHPYSVQ